MPAWVPNAITVLRIVLLPLWWFEASACADAAYYGGDESQARVLAVLVLFAIGVSDVVDGFLARRFGLTSRTGATLDALADKLAQVVLLVFFTFRAGLAFERVPLAFFLLIISRDLILAAGTLLIRARRGSVSVVHAWHGKLASLLLFVLLAALTAGTGPTWTAPAFWALGLLITVSTFLYVRDGWAQWRQRARPGVGEPDRPLAR